MSTMHTSFFLSLLLLLLLLDSTAALLPHPPSSTIRKKKDSNKPQGPQSSPRPNKKNASSAKKSSVPVLTFSPDSLIAGIPANIRIALDISGLPRDVRKSVDNFIVYQIDPFTGAKLPVSFPLKDNGRAPNGDRKRRDFIFSNSLPFRSDNTFESLSFEAVPVISGVEDPTSSLVTVVTKAVTVFPPPPSMDVQTHEQVATVPSLKGLELQVTYVWKSDLNLNSATEFLGDVGGYRCPGNNDLVIFEGEKRDLVNEETSIVQLGRALDEGKWKRSTLVKLRAGWRNTRSQEPAEIVVVLRDEVTKEELSETTLSMPITPGSQKRCARDVVGVVNVLIDDAAHIILSAM